MFSPFPSRIRAFVTVLLAAVVVAACAPSDPDPGDSSPAAASAGSGASGKFYRRTTGTTAMALSGSQSYFCAWDDCPSGATCGVKVYGNDKGSSIDWQIPTSSTATATTTMDVVQSGGSLTLTYQGARVGDYTQVSSWAEAAKGDGGYCGGSTSTAGSGGGSSGGGSGGGSSGATTGRISVWTSRSSLPQAISVSIDGSSVGSLSTYFTSTPSCGDAGTLTRTVSPGVHQVTASAGASMSWGPSSATVTAGGCSMMHLN